MYDQFAAGGMAKVHLGRLLGPVGFSRDVAIKQLHPNYAADPEFVSMFVDEARLAARIRHPNVVQALDVVTSQGELFVVLETPCQHIRDTTTTMTVQHHMFTAVTDVRAGLNE